MKKFLNYISTLLIFVFIVSVQGQNFFYKDPLSLPEGLEEIYLKGLNFLCQRQNNDGSWKLSSYGQTPGVVGLCVLAFLAHGDDPENGLYSTNIKKALNFILQNMNKENGYIGNSMYNHAFATLAIAEAYGVVMDDRLGPALEKAVQLILSAQKRNQFGGWRYSPDSNDADTTVTGACMVALFAAANAGIKVPDESIQKGLEFYKSCQDASGGIGYTNSQGPNTIRTGIASLVWALAKQKNSNEYKKTTEFLEGRGPESIEEAYLFYGLYYLSQTFFHYKPIYWERWNSSNIKYLKSIQSEDGSWNSNFGPEFSTACALLSLALNYRYLPIYER
ncbi:MAG TPA: terpene cyclase/mutase family protein [Victivallales bacterium]|nr:terpene cyclase/mutase family protein [Victivallales bacterium]HPO89772.1 terpene cyclase/mutase family protein [Victivallales bacterium]HRU01145.1 terpene cyclase/mutase family protein [Victivallales bacterium]